MGVPKSTKSVTAEYEDAGISGATRSRPQLDAMMQAARRRQCDAVVCWKLDRMGRSLAHLVTLLDEITSLGIGFVSLGESIDLSTSAGRMRAQKTRKVGRPPAGMDGQPSSRYPQLAAVCHRRASRSAQPSPSGSICNSGR